MNLLAAFDIIKTLEGMRSDIVGSKLAAVMSLGTIVAAVFAGVILLKLSNDYMEGQGISLWFMLRPFIILLCVCNFNSFVATPLHTVVNIMTKGMSNACSVSAMKYIQAFADAASTKGGVRGKWTDISNRFTAEQESGTGWAFNLVDKLQWDKTKGPGKWLIGVQCGINAYAGHRSNAIANPLFMTIESLIAPLLLLIMLLVFVCQQCLCYIYLTILTLIGPFVFAFGILGWFTDSIKSWIAKYVQIAFWIPVGHMVLFCCYRILISIAKVDVAFSFGANGIHCICLMACIISIASVPKIASMIIDSSGAGGAEQSIAGMAKSGLGAAASAAIKAVA